MMPWFDPDPTSVRAARMFVADQLRAMGAHSMIPDALLLTSELASNAVRHARTRYSVQVAELPDHRVRIAIGDEDPRPPHVVDAAPTDTSGRGMQIVDLLADTWGVSDEATGKSVWIELGS